MDINKKCLTLVYCSYKNPENDLSYLEYLAKNLNKTIDIIYLFDNCLDQKLRNAIDNLEEKRIRIVSDGNNRGKFLAFFYCCNFIKTKYIKLMDYDDSINCKELHSLENLLKKMNDVEGEFTFYHTAAKIYKESKYWGKRFYDQTLEDELIKESADVSWKIIPNAQAIYNTAIFNDINKQYYKFLKKLDYYDDDFLTMINQGFTSYTRKLNVRPYIQNHALGQTSTENQRNRNDFYKVIYMLYKFNKQVGLNIKNIGPSETQMINQYKWRISHFSPIKRRMGLIYIESLYKGKE